MRGLDQWNSNFKFHSRILVYQTLGCFILQFAIVNASGQDTLGAGGLHESPDTVLINFPRKFNGSKAIARHLYLPPSEEPDFILPEVIDNRVRNAFPRPTPSPAIDLKAPVLSDYHFVGIKPQAGNYAKMQKDSDGPSYITVNSMSCKNSDDEVYFRASITPPPQLRDTPIIDGSDGDACKVDKKNGNEYKIDFAGETFWKCGVQDCSTESGKFYCLNIRFPAISGLRLREDTKVLLRCRTQQRTTSHTKRFNIKTLDTSARMAPRVATGGHKNAFETEVGLYRKTFGSDHLFDVKIQPGGTVILGEEVLLRVVVRDGDGWKYSRLSDVTVNYIENKRRKKFMNSVWILDSNGCLNPDLREICSREQYRVSPLESYLIFEAFMFDNMKETDQMIMTVKVTGCTEGADCILNCPAGHVRKTRSPQTYHNNTIDWHNDISFRVVLPERVNSTISHENHMIIPYILSSLILVAIAALLCTIKVLKNQKIKTIPF